ncbi:unknown [Methanoculleus sp. CAG:1088]|nr:unknown [Methanoculleus sp. CAG:1088]
MEEKQWRILGGGAYEGGSKRKKLLVPIIALMLCAVAVIGAGYAYQSSVSVQNNTVAGGSLVVETDTASFLTDGAPDVIFTQDKVYDKGGSYKVSIKAAGAGDAIKDSSGASVDMTIGEGASASLLGSAKVTITNNSGKAVTTLTAKVTISGDPLSIGETTLNEIVQEFLIVVSPTVKVSVLNNTESADILATDVGNGNSAEVNCNIYVVIKDTTVVTESSETVSASTLASALANAKLTVEFVASGN